MKAVVAVVDPTHERGIVSDLLTKVQKTRDAARIGKVIMEVLDVSEVVTSEEHLKTLKIAKEKLQGGKLKLTTDNVGQLLDILGVLSEHGLDYVHDLLIGDQADDNDQPEESEEDEKKK